MRGQCAGRVASNCHVCVFSVSWTVWPSVSASWGPAFFPSSAITMWSWRSFVKPGRSLRISRRECAAVVVPAEVDRRVFGFFVFVERCGFILRQLRWLPILRHRIGTFAVLREWLKRQAKWNRRSIMEGQPSWRLRVCSEAVISVSAEIYSTTSSVVAGLFFWGGIVDSRDRRGCRPLLRTSLRPADCRRT